MPFIMDDKIVSPVDGDDKILSPVSSDPTPLVSEANTAPPTRSITTPASSSGPSRTAHGKEKQLALAQPIWIKTRGQELESGFEYTKPLFDLRIDPAKWDEFCGDIKRATKLNSGDKAAIISTIAGFSLIGLTGIGIVLGERVKENKRTSRVLTNRGEGGLLAEVLIAWNETYFKEFGVRAWVEVSEHALREHARKSGEQAPQFVRAERSFVEKTPLVIFNKQSWKRRMEEKKYMVVISPLEGVAELESTEFDADAAQAAELQASERAARELIAEELVEMMGEPALSYSESDPFADPPSYCDAVGDDNSNGVSERADVKGKVAEE